MTRSEAIQRLKSKAERMEILAAAERGPGARAAGERMRLDAEAIRLLLQEVEE